MVMAYWRFKDINRENLGEKFEFRGRVELIRQTSGPTLMVITDGVTNFTFKAFLKPGARAYPDIKEGDFVKGIAVVYERNNELEGEVLHLELLGDEEKDEFCKEMDSLLKDSYKAVCLDFSIKSDVYDKLKDRFEKAAYTIRKAVFENRPIIIRHNADCDGYVAAICVERAILNLMRERNVEQQMEFINLKRAPSKAPFYEYEDALKDLIGYLINKNRLGSKDPLVIIMDNGSTEEDIIGIKQMKMYGSDVIVIDHHYPGETKDGKTAVDEFVNVHINPYLVGHDSNVCAGMLGFELARFISGTELSFMLPAVAGVMDHSRGKEFDQYFKKANEEGFRGDYLERLGEVIDFEIHNIKFFEAREFLTDLFFDIDKQKEIVDLLYDEIKKRYDRMIPVIDKFASVKKVGDFHLVLLDGEKTIFRGEYPAIGKTTNFTLDYFEKKLKTGILAVVYGSSFMTVRASESVDFNVNDFISYLERNYKYVNPNGGGHEKAGSVRFVEYGKEDVLKAIKEFIHRKK